MTSRGFTSAQIARIFGIPADMVLPPLRAPFPDMLCDDPWGDTEGGTVIYERATGLELDRRLAEHLCVWCAVELADASADPLFCGPDHAYEWQRARNGKTATWQPEREP